MQGLILTCVCCVVSEMLHITSIQMCNNPVIEIHSVCIVYGRKTECTIICPYIHLYVHVSDFSRVCRKIPIKQQYVSQKPAYYDEVLVYSLKFS